MPRSRPRLVGLDTNVLVRVLIGDDPHQTRIAEAIFLEHTRGDGVFVALVVLAEIAWVLRAGYHLDRGTIHERIARLVATKGVFLEAPEVVFDALDRHARGSADLPDLLIAGRCSEAGARPIYTFDRHFAAEDDRAVLLG